MTDRFALGRGRAWEAAMSRSARRALRRQGYWPDDKRLVRRLPRRGLSPTWGAFWADVNRSLEK